MNTAMRLMQLNGWGYQAPAEEDGASTPDAEPSSTIDGTEDKPTGIGAEFNPDTTGTLSSTERVELANKQQAEESEGGGKEKAAPTTPETTETTEEVSSDSDKPNYTYKGVAVEIENKPEVVEAFKDKGLDIDKVNGELFSEDGLSDKTREELNSAFGKASVDMYLQGWANSNDAAIERMNSAQSEYDAEVTTIIKETAGENLTAVLAWANDNLSAKEYEEYRTRINGEDTFAMRLALQDLTARSGVSTAEKIDDEAPNLPETPSVRQTALSGGSREGLEGNQGLSSAEYQKLFEPTGKNKRGIYHSDPAKYDALRELGRNNGR